jgi:hypothetical protein
LAVTDGDADVYVLGPMFARFSGFGAGNVGAKSTNVDHFGADDNFNAYKWTWSSYKSAGSDEILYISSADPLKAGSITTNRTFRVGVWGWSEFGESGADGSEWRLSFAMRCCQDTDQYQPVFALEKQIEPVGGDGRVSRR